MLRFRKTGFAFLELTQFVFEFVRAFFNARLQLVLLMKQFFAGLPKSRTHLIERCDQSVNIAAGIEVRVTVEITTGDGVRRRDGPLQRVGQATDHAHNKYQGQQTRYQPGNSDVVDLPARRFQCLALECVFIGLRGLRQSRKRYAGLIHASTMRCDPCSLGVRWYRGLQMPQFLARGNNFWLRPQRLQAAEVFVRRIERLARITCKAAAAYRIDNAINKPPVLAFGPARKIGTLRHQVCRLRPPVVGHHLIDQHPQQWQQNGGKLQDDLALERTGLDHENTR